MEYNIRLYRGKTAQEIPDNTDFKQLKSNGVTHIVALFGTVDLLHMPYNNQTSEVAQSLADCANKVLR